VFAVLKAAYPQSSEDLRTAVIARANQGRASIPEGAERTAEYEKYNLILWLHQSDPDCLIAQTAFSEIQGTHSDFGAREHPDMDIEFGPVQMGLQSPLGPDELLSKPADEWIDFLLSYEPDRPFGPNREGLTDALTTATMRNYQWSWQLASGLKQRGAWRVDLWAALVRGWTGSALPDSAWHDALTLLDSSESLHEPLANDIANLLEDGIKKSVQPIPPSCFAVVRDLSTKLWTNVRTEIETPRPMKKTSEPDWVMRAINHPAGRLTLFWLSWLARQRREAAANWKCIPTELRSIFESILISETYAAELGRVLLASQLNLLFSADEEWAKERVLPLFDWDQDGKRACQAFHGFLTWGRQTEELLPYLLPYVRKDFLAHC